MPRSKHFTNTPLCRCTLTVLLSITLGKGGDARLQKDGVINPVLCKKDIYTYSCNINRLRHCCLLHWRGAQIVTN